VGEGFLRREIPIASVANASSHFEFQKARIRVRECRPSGRRGFYNFHLSHESARAEILQNLKPDSPFHLHDLYKYSALIMIRGLLEFPNYDATVNSTGHGDCQAKAIDLSLICHECRCVAIWKSGYALQASPRVRPVDGPARHHVLNTAITGKITDPLNRGFLFRPALLCKLRSLRS
jgi:hypothetical protein